MKRLPLPLRTFNAVGRAWRAAGLSPRPLDPTALEDEALARVGRSRDALGPASEYRSGLEALCTALESLPELPTSGRFAARRQMVKALEMRLRRRAWKERAPERFLGPLTPPVVVLGLPRTGTTFLHRLLASVPGARALPAWEVAAPFAPLTGPDKRREAGERGARVVARVMPEIGGKHRTGADEPEECMHALDETFLTWSYWSNHAVPAYTAWTRQADDTAAYRVWRDVLQYVQHGSPGKRLTLKSPSHTAHIDALLDQVPDARIVWTHRDPAVVVPSFASLIETTRSVSATAATADPHALGRELSDHLAWVVSRGVQSRKRIPTGQLIDIGFDELRTDPLGTVARIHDHFGLPWSPEASAAVSGRIAERTRNAKVRHGYSLADYGLSEGLITEQFGEYRAASDRWTAARV